MYKVKEFFTEGQFNFSLALLTLKSNKFRDLRGKVHNDLRTMIGLDLEAYVFPNSSVPIQFELLVYEKELYLNTPTKIRFTDEVITFILRNTKHLIKDRKLTIQIDGKLKVLKSQVYKLDTEQQLLWQILNKDEKFCRQRILKNQTNLVTKKSKAIAASLKKK